MFRIELNLDLCIVIKGNWLNAMYNFFATTQFSARFESFLVNRAHIFNIVFSEKDFLFT